MDSPFIWTVKLFYISDDRTPGLNAGSMHHGLAKPFNSRRS